MKNVPWGQTVLAGVIGAIISMGAMLVVSQIHPEANKYIGVGFAGFFASFCGFIAGTTHKK